MANKLLQLPGNRLFNNSNIASPGGTATLYLSKTSTLANFLDASAVPLGPTITANGLGQLPDAYGDETVAYRVILRDSSGVQLDGGDIDPFYFGRDNSLITTTSGSSVSTRALLAAIANPVANQSAILTESGREGTFVFDTSDLSAEVTADTAQGVYVAPSSDTTGASGAWVRKFTGPLQVEWFGADNAGFATMLTLASTLGIPAAVTNQSVLLTAQHSLPASSTLIIDGGEIYATDNTLESTLLVENDDVTIEGRNGGQVRGALTNTTGLTGVCVLARNAARTKIRGLATQDGKYGLSTLDCDDLEVADCTIRNTFNWGLMSGGNRNFTFRNVIVDTTRDTAASDCFKVYGLSAVTYSTRTSYNGAFIDCIGIGAGGVGQAFDVISDNDAADDLYNITFINPVGRACGDGFFEIKVTELVLTNYPLHGVTIKGGTYYGSGTETVGVSVKDRVFDIDVTGVTVCDVGIGFNTSASCRQIRLKDCTSVRSRKEGVKWLATGGSNIGNQLIRPRVIDPNYGQGASTYAGISIQAGTNLQFDSPSVIRSQGASGTAHSYGIEVLAGVTGLNITGNVALVGHATAAINNAGTSVYFPETITLPEINLASGSGASNLALGLHRSRFQLCAYSVLYTAASNVGRDVQMKARDTSTSTTMFTYATNVAGALYAVEQTQLTNPVELLSSRPAFNAAIQADPDYPGSPTGKIIITLHGYRDAVNPS